jgi:excisionase family DNA binding protein
LGSLFYRFISENFSAYIQGGDTRINYAELNDVAIAPGNKRDAIKTKGYFIYPSQLFANVAAIETSAVGYPSERVIRGLLADNLKVTERTIYRLAGAIQILAFKVGGSWRFSKTEIDRWIRERSSGPTYESGD